MWKTAMPRGRRNGWIFSFLAVIAVTADFQNANAEGYGVGIHSCAEFAKLYASNPSMAEDIYFTWAQGFMSGLNMASAVYTGSARNFEGTRAEMLAEKIRVRSYCDTHPLAQYLSAIIDLYNSFPAKKENSN
jgi:hypothetical protein